MVVVGDVARMALALPGTIEQDHHGSPSYRVGGKIFCTLRPTLPRLMVKLDPQDQRNFCDAYPETVTPVPGYWGRKGATYVDYGEAAAALIETLLKLAWSRLAARGRRSVA